MVTDYCQLVAWILNKARRQINNWKRNGRSHVLILSLFYFIFLLFVFFLLQETKLILVSDCYLGFEQEHSLPKINWYCLLVSLKPIWRNATIPTVEEFRFWWHEIENGWLWSLVDESKMVICTINRDWHQYQTGDEEYMILQHTS